jgi:RNA polymerase sigma factor (sigma-70 family)
MAMTETGVEAEAARAADALYREHAATVFRYVYAVLGNRSDAEDVTQTTFVNALRALERGVEVSKPEHWLITIAHNHVRQRFRQQAARPREVELDRDAPAAAPDDEGPSLDDLVRALQRIPPTQREALVLRELEGRSYKEIAAILDVTPGALEGLIFRARRSVAEELENLVTCDRAELALSKRLDGRLGLKERRRLSAHLAECESCARVAASSRGRRRAFKALAALPLPLSLSLFKGAPSASAAAGLPAIGTTAGATAAASVGVGAGVSAKIAVGLAAVAVAGGGAYEGAKVLQDPATPPPAKAAPAPAPAKAAAAVPAAAAVARPVAATPKSSAKAKPVVADERTQKPARANPQRGRPVPARGKPAQAKPVQVAKPLRPARPVQSAKPERAAKPTTAAKAVQSRRTPVPVRTVPAPKPKPALPKAKGAAPRETPVPAPRPKQQKPR